MMLGKCPNQSRFGAGFLYVALSLAIVFSWSIQGWGNSLDCQAALVAEHAEFLKSFVKGNPTFFTGLRLFSRSEEFRKFYRRKTGLPVPLPAVLTPGLMRQYHEAFLSKFNNPAVLEELRSDSLLQSLEVHGYTIDRSRSGWENLVKLSQRNLRRQLLDIPEIDAYKSDSEINQMVQSVHPVLSRNSLRKDILGDVLLSSRQLKNYGGLGGANTQFDFNQSVIQSDDNVFFFVDWAIGTEYVQDSLADGYGHIAHFLDVDYARDHAWTSAFVMYSYDLINTLNYGPYRSSMSLGKKIDMYDRSLSGQALSRLQYFDYTFQDFESMVRDLLGYELMRIKTEATPEQWASSLSRQDPLMALRKLVLEKHSIPRMEVKVPVSVPSRYILMDRYTLKNI